MAVETSSQRAKFRRAFDAHFNALNRYCLRRIPVDDVNDVVAEIFLVAWRKIDTMPDEPDSLPWLYRVAHHEISNRRRTHRRLQSLSERIGGLASHPQAGPETIVVRNDLYQRLLHSLSTLRPEDQEVLLLKTHEDLDYSQMSVALGCSPDAARKRLTRAVHRLRKVTDLSGLQGAGTDSRAIDEEVTNE